MSKRSLGFYTFLSMVGCILFAWGCGCANEAHHEKSYRGMYSFLRTVDFQLDWSGLVTATFLTGRFAAEWCIRICIWWENQTPWLKCHSLSLTFYTVITFRDDVVPYYGACRSISKTLTICQRWSRWLTFIAVIGWCQVSSVRDELGHQLYCDWNNWFGSRISLSGVSALCGCLVIPPIYSALVSLKTCNVEQNFCSPLRFLKLELFWRVRC